MFVFLNIPCLNLQEQKIKKNSERVNKSWYPESSGFKQTTHLISLNPFIKMLN